MQSPSTGGPGGGARQTQCLPAFSEKTDQCPYKKTVGQLKRVVEETGLQIPEITQPTVEEYNMVICLTFSFKKGQVIKGDINRKRNFFFS